MKTARGAHVILPAGMHAVELPARTVELELGRRRHRWVTAPAALVFACATPLGIGLALVASARTERGLARAILALRLLAIVLVASLPATIPSLLVLAALGFTGRSERRAAATAIAIGALGIVWFGLAVGAYASALAAFGLLVGGLVWLQEAGYSRSDEVHRLRRARSGARGL